MLIMLKRSYPKSKAGKIRPLSPSTVYFWVKVKKPCCVMVSQPHPLKTARNVWEELGRGVGVKMIKVHEMKL